MNSSTARKLVGSLILLVVVLSAGYILTRGSDPLPPIIPQLPQGSGEDMEIKKFSSDDEFKTYIAETKKMQGYYGGRGIGIMKSMPLVAPMRGGMEESIGVAQDRFGVNGDASLGSETGGVAEPDRVSATNVQVIGIDEPDMVKTDGKEIYVSTPGGYPVYYEKMMPVEPTMIEGSAVIEKITPRGPTSRPIVVPPYPDYNRGGVKAVKAFPPADLKIDSTIDMTGDLLLTENMLIVFPGNQIVGFDISNPTKPEKKWSINVESNTVIVTSRLADGKMYVVTHTGVWSGDPCPIRPLSIGDEKINIPCTEVYYPVRKVPVDTTFSVMIIDPASGEVEKKTAFIGGTGQSVIYMSPGAVYVTYGYQGDFIKYVIGFFKQNNDLVSTHIIARLEKLQGYDLSDSAKMTEFDIIMQQLEQNLEGDDRLKIENEFANRMEDYHKEHKRDLERTGIVKIDATKLAVTASGDVPGHLLNQFALDEYEKNLRVAVTVGENSGWWGFGFSGGRESANDVYVLDEDLDVIGSATDMGLTERIYSVRFIHDKGYVVTFRKTDPFYVLDLSNPRKPEVKGELKIPGFSSYLHPISASRILGIGQDGSQVKLSLFDVSSAQNPKEADKYLLSEHWSEVSSTHHAFLQDDKHKVFFLPGGQGGYIFSYAGDKLGLEKAISGIRARRALFINDYFYVVGEDKIIILNESDWERVNEVSL